MPQYYSVPATAPWIYPASLLQQQQTIPGQHPQPAGTPTGAPQLGMRGQTPRSLTPSQDATGGLATPTGKTLHIYAIQRINARVFWPDWS